MTKIYRASDKRLRDQIGKLITELQTAQAGAVLESDYNANTILAANADDTPLPLTVAEQTLVGRITGGNIDDLSATQVKALLDIDLLEGYSPGGMKYDGSTGYYSDASVAITGNVWTLVCTFKLPPFTGDRFGRIIRVIGISPQSRCTATIASSDFSTAAARNRITLFAANTAGATIWDQIIDVDICDNAWHTLFASFNATTGAVTVRLDGLSPSLVTNTAPTTGTLETGSIGVGFGADHNGNDKLPAIIGFLGYRDAYLTNWDDFMDAAGVPLDIDESGWTEWGAQPLFWNPHGQMDRNLGSNGDMTKNGAVTLYMQGVESAWTVPDEELDTRVAAIEADYTTEAEADARVVVVAGTTLYTKTVTGTINDDEVYTYDFGVDVFSGSVIFSRNSASFYGLFTIRAAASSAFCASMVSAGMTATTGILTGTTGADGILSISTHTNNRLYVQNRLGASLSFTMTINAAV